MMMYPRLLGALAACAVAAAPAVAATTKAPAKEIPTTKPPSFAYALGNETSGPNIFSISATAPRGSKLSSQIIRFAMKKADASGRTWTFFYISSGKSRSQAQVERMLYDALRKFPTAPGGKELMRIGSAKGGGELRIVKEGPNALLFSYNPAMQPSNPRLTQSDAAMFAQILKPEEPAHGRRGH
jgi:hypothetical protein